MGHRNAFVPSVRSVVDMIKAIMTANELSTRY